MAVITKVTRKDDGGLSVDTNGHVVLREGDTLRSVQAREFVVSWVDLVALAWFAFAFGLVIGEHLS